MDFRDTDGKIIEEGNTSSFAVLVLITIVLAGFAIVGLVLWKKKMKRNNTFKEKFYH